MSFLQCYGFEFTTLDSLSKICQLIERLMMGKVVISALCVTGLFASALSGPAAGRDVIDFETGFSRLDLVSTVTTGSNALSISLSNEGETFIANVGIPKDAFENMMDTELLFDQPVGGNAGEFFLTDGVTGENNFLFDFDLPVSQFSLDIYDFRGDGGARPTDFASLVAYADKDRTNAVAEEVFKIPLPRPDDGATLTMSVAASSIAAVTLGFSTFDRGTGLDNITFVTVPEPTTLLLLALGALPLIVFSRHRGRH